MEQHVPVLLAQAMEALAPAFEVDGWLIDCTVGLGGHAEACLERLPRASLLAVDRDPQALERSRRRLERFGERVRYAAGPFGAVESLASRAGVTSGVRGVLADLGVSSMQLDHAERGFSFARDGPLDMRMEGAESSAPSAAEIVNTYSEDALTRIIRQYGEEPKARRIARAIVDERQQAPFETTSRLAGLVERLKPARHGRGRGPGRGAGRRIHPATQTFQALRIEVNQELDELRALIDQAVRMLDQDGRLVMISYHSLEDRIVKHGLRDLATGEIEPITGRTRAETQVIEVLTKKPVRPSDDEVAANPRSRSARLRAARRL
ncbi:MAG: 16S rRNA (cytosine(1402)-N(4))-methyltransferase RsmH [Acidobacteriota bacterium]